MKSRCITEEPCVGAVVLDDILGTPTVFCSSALKQVIGLPTNIQYGDCSKTLMDVHPCQVSYYEYNCDHSRSNWWLVVTALAGLILTIVLMILRWFKTKGIFFSNGMKLKRQGRYIVARDIHTREEIKKYSLFQVLLYLLVGLQINPVSSCLKRNADGYFMAVGGATLCTTSGNQTLDYVGYKLHLTLEYLTADWSMSFDSDWGCVGGKCPDASECVKINNKPVVTTGKGNEHSKQFCFNYPGACAFGRGYRLGASVLSVKSDTYQVYEISKLSLQSNIMHYSSCSISNYGVPNILSGPHVVVQSRSNKFICPLSNYRGNPTFHELGDLQFKLGFSHNPREQQILSNTLIMDWDKLTCGHKWYDSSCSTPESFISKISEVCVAVPGDYAGGRVVVTSKGDLVYTTNNPLMVSISCSNTTIIEDKASCKLDRQELWGVRLHGTGIYLAIVVSSLNRNQDMLITNPCSGEAILVPCDDKVHFYSVSEEKSSSCNVTDKTMTDFQARLTGNYETSLWQGAPMLSSPLHLVGGSLLGTWVIAVLVLIISSFVVSRFMDCQTRIYSSPLKLN